MHLWKTMRRLGVLLVVGTSLVANASADFHNRFVVYFPQVVKGVINDYYETIIVISNPHTEAVEVVLSAQPSTLLAGTSLLLKPGGTERVKTTGPEPQVGWVRLESTKVLSASAHIIARRSESSTEIVSEVTILAQAPTSKAVVPVFLKMPGSEEALADDTGIAIAVLQPGQIRLTLRDDQGNVVASRPLQDCPTCFASHRARFLKELFPTIPASFGSGSLTIEYIEFNIPRTFATAALYVRGNEMWSAAVQNVDVPTTWSVLFKAGVSEQTAQEMANQYGFVINRFSPGSPTLAFATMLEEVARAVARDPRVDRAQPNAAVPTG